jgi:Domain of unknown function (DUF4157)
MENRFGEDFSQVRVHTGEAADLSAMALSSKAFALGEDIVFGAPWYQPQTPAGRVLLAHELAHVVQQRGDGLPAAGPAVERDAREAAAAMESGDEVTLAQSGSPAVARDEDDNPALRAALMRRIAEQYQLHLDPKVAAAMPGSPPVSAGASVPHLDPSPPPGASTVHLPDLARPGPMAVPAGPPSWLMPPERPDPFHLKVPAGPSLSTPGPGPDDKGATGGTRRGTPGDVLQAILKYPQVQKLADTVLDKSGLKKLPGVKESTGASPSAGSITPGVQIGGHQAIITIKKTF